MSESVSTDAAPTLEEAAGWVGRRLDDVGGRRTGGVEAVYVDSDDGGPVWLQARMGRFGHRTLVPIEHAVGAGERVWVAHERDAIRDAPRVDPGRELDAAAELDLLGHYGFPAGAGRAAALEGRQGVTTRPA